MTNTSAYLYDNRQTSSGKRLRGLEAVEDANTISLLKDLTELDGSICLEIGAGSGSIAEWLARKVGASGSVTATDIEPNNLSGSGFKVLRHDIERDELPTSFFDFIHVRHVLIHLTNPVKALQAIHQSTKIGGAVLIEESDLSTWKADGNSSSTIREIFQNGVGAVLSTYESRGMDTRIGTKLYALLGSAGFAECRQSEYVRSVIGGADEATYQSETATQLADVLGAADDRTKSIRRLADCLLNPGLRYQSRTTVSVSAVRLA
jgi:SAM-dependent methyltransferase